MDGTLDHTMIRVADLERSLDWYRTHLEYEEKDRHEGDGFTIVYLGPEEMHEDGALLEITHNEGERPEIGDAWGHIAVRVPEGELEAAYEQLLEEGVEDYRDPESCGGSYAFVTDPDGHEVEIVQRDHGARWSLDHTMVRVDDLAEDWATLMTREAPDYRDPASNDHTYAFTTDQDGHEVELLERDPGAGSLFPF